MHEVLKTLVFGILVTLFSESIKWLLKWLFTKFQNWLSDRKPASELMPKGNTRDNPDCLLEESNQ